MSGVHVRIQAGAEHYAVPVECVLEVAELGEIMPLPGAPPTILGVRNLRGQVIPVIDLAAVFGLAANGDAERVVVAEESDRQAGLAVKAVVDVGPLPEASEEAESQFLSGAALVGSDLVGVVDIKAVLDSVAVQAQT